MKLIVLGAGESGVGAALLGKKQGWDVFLSDKGEIQNKYKDELVSNQISFEEKQHTIEILHQADLIVKSPGIPDHISLILELEQKGIPIVSEIEFADKYNHIPTVGITGSNGKTTTTLLTNHVLNKGGIHSKVAGNIGDSFAKAVTEEIQPDQYVLELSSFQLDGIKKYKPEIAILTNITPDHLDRYDHKFENYVSSKFKITENQNGTDFLIYNADDPVIQNKIDNMPIKAKKLPFSLKKKLENGAFLQNEEMIVKVDREEFRMGDFKFGFKRKAQFKECNGSFNGRKSIEY